MSGFFSNFPTIDYNGKKIRDIMKRSIAIEKIKNVGVPLQPFKLEENERCDYLASALFSRPDFDYIFYMLNDIIDPYYEWYLTQEQLDELIATKYGGESLTVRYYYYYDMYELISNTDYKIDPTTYLDLTSTEKLLYQGVETSKLFVTPETYDSLPAAEQPLYTPVSNRTFEYDENEKRKFLNIVLPEYGNVINRQVRATLNDQPINLR